VKDLVKLRDVLSVKTNQDTDSYSLDNQNMTQKNRRNRFERRE